MSNNNNNNPWKDWRANCGPTDPVVVKNVPSDILEELRALTAHGENTVCDDPACQDCCPHDEFDHDICLDCGYERDPGIAIDRAMDALDAARDNGDNE